MYICIYFIEIKRIVKNFDPMSITDSVRKELEAKLEVCRNQENNPNSDQYRAKHAEWDDDDMPPVVTSNDDSNLDIEILS